MATATLPTTGVCNTNAASRRGLSAVAIDQMQVVYKNASNKYALAQSDAVGTSTVEGLARNSAGAADGPIDVLTEGIITGLSGLVQGTVYALSPDVAGDVIPLSELSAGEIISIIGIGVTTTSLELGINNTGIAVPA